MSSKTYTNVILTIIAVLLVSFLLKDLFESTANKVYAGDEKYKEFQIVTTYTSSANDPVQEKIKSGWKPIGIAQSQTENRSQPDTTILFGR